MNGFILPYYFDKPDVNGDIYLQLGNNWFLPMLLELPQNRIFQQDRASPHYISAVIVLLGALGPSFWSGSGGSASWPARSPDLTPNDSFL